MLAADIRYNSNAIDLIYNELVDSEQYQIESRLDSLELVMRNNSRFIVANSNAIVNLKTTNDAEHEVLTNNIRYNSNTLNYLVGIETTSMNIATDTSIDNIRFIKDGFSIAAGKTLTINTPLRVSGDMAFADAAAALTLNGDLTLASDAQFTTIAKINGNGKTMHLGGTLRPSNDITISGGLIIDGNGNDVYFDGTNQLVLDSSTSVTLQNMNLHLKGTDPIAPTTTGQITLRNVTIKLEADTSISAGYLHINENVAVSGESFKFSYLSEYPLNIHNNSLFHFDIGTELVFNPGGSVPHTTGQRDLFRASDRTSLLSFNGSTFTAPTSGINFEKCTLVFDNKVTLNNKDALGDYNTDPDLAITINSENANVYLLAGARVEVNGYVDILPYVV